MNDMRAKGYRVTYSGAISANQMSCLLIQVT